MNGRSAGAGAGAGATSGVCAAARRAASGSTTGPVGTDVLASGASSHTPAMPISPTTITLAPMRASRRLDAATAAGSTTASRARHLGQRSRSRLNLVPHEAQTTASSVSGSRAMRGCGRQPGRHRC